MVKKQSIARRNQMKFVVLTMFIFFLEFIATLVFMAQNEFLRYASDGLLVMTIATTLLPVFLFVIAFVCMRKSTLLRRVTQAIVWAFAGMLINTIAIIGWFITDSVNYGTDILQLLYGPGITTLLVYVIGLVIYRRQTPKTSKLLIPGWFEKAFILFGFVLVTLLSFIFIRDVYTYGLAPYPYLLYTILPLVLMFLLPIIGFVSLRIVKNKVSRLYMAIFGVSFALYVGTGLSNFANAAQSTGWIQDLLMMGAYVVATIVYIILLVRIRNRVKANEKL